MKRSVSLLLICTCSHIAFAQQSRDAVRVSVSVTEKTGGLFQSVVSGALRQLPGVVVVSPAENAEYEWTLTVLCDYNGAEERCENSNAYSVAYSIRQRLNRDGAIGWWITQQDFLKKFALSDMNKLNAAPDSLFADARIYSYDLLSGVAHLGRQKYEQFFADMVRKFDASCVERRRVSQRLIRENNFGAIGRATENLPKDMCVN
jgi:hypothetical protein